MVEEPSCVLCEFILLGYVASNIVEAYIMCCFVFHNSYVFFLLKEYECILSVKF